MNKLKNTIILLVIFLLPLFLGCTKKTNTDQIKVVFGVSPFQDTLLPMLGKEKGWYDEEGIDVQFKILGWTEIQEALSSQSNDKIDLGINNISSVIATHNKNPELIYLYGFNTFDNGFALMIRPGGKLKPLLYFLDQGLDRSMAIKMTAAQLKNKTVITTSNTDMEQGVAAAASRGGIEFTDVKIINLNPDEGLAAFLNGEGDAYIGGIPQRTRAGKEGMVEMLTGVDLGPAPINGIVTTLSYYNNNKKVLAKILKVWFKIVQYVNNNMDESANIIISILNKNSAAGFTVDDFKAFWDNYEHYPRDLAEIESDILSPDGNNYWKSRWNDCNHYFYNIKGVIPEPVPPEEAFYMLSMHTYLKTIIVDKTN